MDFEFSPEQLAFVKEVESFLDANDDPEVFDLTRENMAQIVDTPKRRAFMASLGERGWLGMTWPKEYGGSEGEGVYEYLLNEQLAGRGGPQIGKGVGIVGKTIIRHGNERLKAEFLPKILRNEVEFAVGYSEPNAGSDAASMQLKATKDDGGWILNGQKTWTTSAHFAEWYWVGGRTDPDVPSTPASPCSSSPSTSPASRSTPSGPWATSAPTRSSSTTSSSPTTTWWGEVGRGFQYISEALDLERFTMFTFSPIAQRFELLVEYVRTTVRDGVPLKDDPVIRQRLAQLATQLEVARVMGLKFVFESSKGGAAPTAEASEYKLFATELSRAPGQRLHGHRRARVASCGSRPRRRRWPAAPSRPTATPSSTPSAAGPRRSRRTSSPGASSDCRRTSEVADATRTERPPRRGHRARPLDGRAGGALHAPAGRLRGAGGEGRARSVGRRRAD